MRYNWILEWKMVWHAWNMNGWFIFLSLPKEVVNLYANELIPKAIEYWESSLKVKYPHSPLYLGRFCLQSQFYYSIEDPKSQNQIVACEQDCSKETKCGDFITIPDEHLDVCRYCVNGRNCQERGKRHEGVQADFILYISAINTEHCGQSNTVAFASYCQLESKYNRYMGITITIGRCWPL
jgi:leishmanolysin-like peptidase